MAGVQIQKTLELNFENIPPDKHEEASQEVGDFLVNEILRYMQRGQSPVGGEGSWPALDKEYAADEHGGNRKPTLNADGDLREAIGYEVTPTGLKVGVMKDSEQGKADGHNNFSGESKLPRRRFIPDDKQGFTKEIDDKIERILDVYRESDPGSGEIDIDMPIDPNPEQPAAVFTQARLDRVLKGISPTSTTVAEPVGALLGTESIEAFLNRRFG